MSDITKLFKATVKTVRSRHKAQGLVSGPDKSILGTAKTSEFNNRAKHVVSSITQLRDFLLDNRKEYINAAGLSGTEGRFTDAERDQIDADAEAFMRTCRETIKAFHTEATAEHITPQAKEHRENMFSLLDEYLKLVCRIYSQQRAIRVKRVVDRKRIGRLEPEVKKHKSLQEYEKNVDAKEAGNGDAISQETKPKQTNHIHASGQPPVLFNDDDDEEDELSPEEIQMFEEENAQLYDEMNSLVDEVKNIEGKVVEISRLQEIYAEKVLEQDKDIDRLQDTVMGTTENIKDANEEIREAMKNNAGLRVWILFFLIVCSFSLLFLDWYNA